MQRAQSSLLHYTDATKAVVTYSFSKLVFAALGAALLVDAKLDPPGGPRKLHYGVVESFKTMTGFPSTVAIWDPAKEDLLKCVAGRRTEIDPVSQTATFVLTFPETETSPEYEVPFYAKSEQDGMVTLTIPGDPTVREGQYYYADTNCVVLGLEFQGDQCILWVRKELKDSVPQICIDHFVDTCGAEVPEHSRDLCFDGEGDY